MQNNNIKFNVIKTNDDKHKIQNTQSIKNIKPINYISIGGANPEECRNKCEGALTEKIACWAKCTF